MSVFSLASPFTLPRSRRLEGNSSVLRFALIVGLCAAVSTAAFATPLLQVQGNTPDPAARQTTPGDAPDFDPGKVICRNVKPPTGTRIAGSRNRQRICMTKADWEQQERDAQEALRVRDIGICSNGNDQCRG